MSLLWQFYINHDDNVFTSDSPSTGFITLMNICIRNPNSTIVVEIKEIIHSTVLKSFDSAIKLNEILMTSLNYTTIAEVKKNRQPCQN